ncbi:unnamed protein product [Mytilus coruscus]|uniref:ZP domain-containing protein n=1 Tax=Mytilus coruscus TaxID=42192 RepID=A0A6J8CW68_MYTCO|nr:unnamed protein product [Mytilus coruscus]
MKGFIVSFFVYAIFIEAGITSTVNPTPSPTLEFECDSKGKITNISANGWSLEEFLVLDKDKLCQLNDSSCVQDKSEIHVIHVKTIKREQTLIIGGKDAHFYELKCKPGDFVGKASANINIAQYDYNLLFDKSWVFRSGASYTPKVHTFGPNSTAIALTIEKKEGGGQLNVAVKLGEHLSLKFKGPVGYIVDPLQCIAYAGAVKSSSQELWSNTTCSSKNPAILENFWTKDHSANNIISITMYAFRFPDSKKVLIECSAHFCPESDTSCNTKCWKRDNNTIGRRRRNAFENSDGKGHFMKKVSTFFTVSDDSETSNRSSGTLNM